MPEKEAQTSTENKVSSSTTKSGSNNKIIILVITIVGAIVVVGTIGYFVFGLVGKKTAETISEKTIEQATGGKVDISNDGKTTTIETDEGEVTIGKNEVPDSFPSDVTVYKGSEVIASAEAEGDITLQLKTSDSVSMVNGFYKSDLSKNGWKETSSVDYLGTFTITAEKGEKQVSVVIATAETDNKTTILIIIIKT